MDAWSPRGPETPGPTIARTEAMGSVPPNPAIPLGTITPETHDPCDNARDGIGGESAYARPSEQTRVEVPREASREVVSWP